MGRLSVRDFLLGLNIFFWKILSIQPYMTNIWSISLYKITRLQETETRPTGWTGWTDWLDPLVEGEEGDDDGYLLFLKITWKFSKTQTKCNNKNFNKNSIQFFIEFTRIRKNTPLLVARLYLFPLYITRAVTFYWTSSFQFKDSLLMLVIVRMFVYICCFIPTPDSGLWSTDVTCKHVTTRLIFHYQQLGLTIFETIFKKTQMAFSFFCLHGAHFYPHRMSSVLLCSWYWKVTKNCVAFFSSNFNFC